MDEHSYDGLLNPKMKRLVVAASHQDNPNVGPGAYDAQDSFIRKELKSNIKFGISKTIRDDPFVKKTTLPSVGPGSYEFWNKDSGYKVTNPTIPREP
jgi:hypothetical protein